MGTEYDFDGHTYTGLTSDKAIKYLRRMGYADGDELVEEMLDAYAKSSTPGKRIHIA